MVVACIALAIALSGASYAAVTLPKNSVGTNQLKKGAVTSVKVKDSSLSGTDIANGSLTGDDINESSLSGVDAATLGGHSASDFALASSGGGSEFDAFVASGTAWIDANSAGKNIISLTRTQPPPATTITQTCTQPGAAAQIGTATGNGNPSAFQPIHLPQGANISGMVADYGDDATSTAANGTLNLTRIPIYSSNGDTQDILTDPLPNTGTAGATATVTDLSVPFNHPEWGLVDNSKYSYVLQAFTTVPATTTLAAASNTSTTIAATVGQTTLRVANLSNVVPGQTITIGTPTAGGVETKTVLSVDLAAIDPAPNVTLTSALTADHPSGSQITSSAVRVSSTTGLVAGQSITIDSGATAETRTVGTIIAGPPAAPFANITLSSALASPHANGANVYVPAASATPAPLAAVALCSVKVSYQLP